MVQELCTGGSLLDVVRSEAPLSEERAAHCFRGIIKSVLHCHQVRGGGHRPAVCDGLPQPSGPMVLTRAALPAPTIPARWACCTATSSQTTSSSRPEGAHPRCCGVGGDRCGLEGGPCRALRAK